MAFQTDDISRVYADALVGIVQAEGGNDRLREIAEEFEALVEFTRADKRFHEFLASPILDVEARGAALGRIMSGNFSELLVRFVLVLNRKGRLAHLASIADAYDAALQVAFGKIEVDVFTIDGQAPDAQMQTVLRDRIQAAVGREPVFHFYADKHMLGGVKLRLGDQLIDGSVATRLRLLRQKLVEQGGSQVRSNIDRFLN